MVPHDDPLGGLRDKRIPPRHRTAVAVVHGETALPSRFNRALEDVRRAEITVHQTKAETRTRWTIGHLGRVIGCPPDFVWPGGRRIVRAVAGGHTRAQTVRVVRGVRTR